MVERVAGVRYGLPLTPRPARRVEEEQLAPLRARPPPPARDRARPATARPERLPRDGRRARVGARVEGHRHARALAARAALRDRADLGRRARACSTTRAREYGFLLHDVGKIGIPDEILLKPRPLTARSERLMQTHTVLGEQMLGGVAFLQGEGLRGRALAPRALGRRAATRTASCGTRSRSARGSSPSPTRSTR